jgi:uncharacterized protein YebE (UPF0316 family)
MRLLPTGNVKNFIHIFIVNLHYVHTVTNRCILDNQRALSSECSLFGINENFVQMFNRMQKNFSPMSNRP